MIERLLEPDDEPIYPDLEEWYADYWIDENDDGPPWEFARRVEGRMEESNSDMSEGDFWRRYA